MATRVLIADDHLVVRQGVRAVLDSGGGYEIVAEARDGREAVDLARRHSPSVIFMDPAMPELNGAEATRRIRKECSSVAVLALSMHSDSRYVSNMLSAGVSGYLLKTCDKQELLRAIEVALSGGTYLSPEVASAIVDDYVNGRDSERADDSILSAREREVLQLLAEGKTAKRIGRMLYVSSRTIDSHRQRIMSKLNVDSVAELTKCAIRMGLTTVQN